MTESKKLNKQEQLAAAKAAWVVGGLVKVDAVEPLDIYVKQWTSKAFREIGALAASFKSKFQDGYNDEREISLELFDADGQPYFDYNDLADMETLATMPVGVKKLLSDAAQVVVWGDYIQKKAQKNKPEQIS